MSIRAKNEVSWNVPRVPSRHCLEDTLGTLRDTSFFALLDIVLTTCLAAADHFVATKSEETAAIEGFAFFAINLNFKGLHV